MLEFVIHGIFAAEFGLRVYYVDNHADYIRQNWWDIGVVIVPPLRPLRDFRQGLD